MAIGVFAEFLAEKKNYCQKCHTAKDVVDEMVSSWCYFEPFGKSAIYNLLLKYFHQANVSFYWERTNKGDKFWSKIASSLYEEYKLRRI